MKIARIETLQADGGWRLCCFVKVTADDGTVGWAEYGEHTGTAGLGAFTNFSPSFAHTPGWPELNPDRVFLASLDRQLAALRQGAGDEVEVMLDVNFHFKTEGFVEVARAVTPHRLMWLELDSYDPAALAHIRRLSPCPIASAEAFLGRRELKRLLDASALDVAIIDVVWNGYLEAMKMAALAEIYEVNVAPHNYGGPLTDLMSAHFAAAIPNLRIMEIDVDDVPWREEFVTVPPRIEAGALVVPQTPGWGTEVNEAAVRARPPR